jgi:glucan phosphoethanolaminetransferase (alkaline phosphatase superfamily)
MKILQSLGYAVPPVSFIGGNLLELVTKNDLKTQIRWMTEVSSCWLFVVLLLFIYCFVVVYSLFCCCWIKTISKCKSVGFQRSLVVVIVVAVVFVVEGENYEKSSSWLLNVSTHAVYWFKNQNWTTNRSFELGNPSQTFKENNLGGKWEMFNGVLLFFAPGRLFAKLTWI